MSYPQKPTIRTSYTAKAQALGDGTLPGVELDVDLNALRASIDAYIDWIRGITRSDGQLANGSVRRETLAGDILLGFDPPSAWMTGTNYVVNATVFEEARFYICTVAHTSGTFSTDLAAGRWELLADFSDVASDILSGDQTIAGNWRFDGTVNTTGGFFINGAEVTVNTPAEAQVLLGLEIGVDVQAQNANLSSLAGLTFAANKGLRTTGANTAALFDLTAAGLALLDDADEAAQRTTLGLGDAATRGVAIDTDFTVGPNDVAPRSSIKTFVDASVGAVDTSAYSGAFNDVSGSRSEGTSYRNTRGKQIMVLVNLQSSVNSQIYLELSADNTNWFRISGHGIDGGRNITVSGLIRDNWYYRVTSGSGTPTINSWWEIY